MTQVMPASASTTMLHHQAGVAEQIEHDADEGVDRDLGHDAAHQRRDMARRGGMGERQPGVQRHEAGLGSGADQHQNQNERRERRPRDGSSRIAAKA